MQVLFKNTVATEADIQGVKASFPWEGFSTPDGWVWVKADDTVGENSQVFALIPDTGTVIDVGDTLTAPSVNLVVVNPGFTKHVYSSAMSADALFIFLAKKLADKVPERNAYTWVLTELDVDHVTYTGMCGKEVGPSIKITHDLVNPMKTPVAELLG